ncbi:VPLPA-CTERM sorting domain-containing protein [Aliiroseovarius sp. S2029]|uniref:VPLPA-CTERM sorting domain-containing protein n=1 Tax=Aliiroseovarius sp. S2029 TaxID=2936988 RepID=UPI0020C06614|nr:VPLPA-CTERM sorting domain-containing protein [Aliiroseovarius sp. S2029]MCK8483473.1 VPLPA-CTERM sorting domain-containing protein [Aliiroseovarius sp. S2029]
MKKLLSAAIIAAGFATTSDAAVLRLDGYTSTVQSVSVNSSPVANTPGTVGATGFNLTDTSGDMGSFVGWCLDIAHYLMSTGSSQNYTPTNDPFSNSFGLSNVARDRVQSVFDANYASLDASNGDQAAAFQMALWEAAYEDDNTALSVSNGLFQASSTGSTTLANQFLLAATNYTGAGLWNLSFLQVDGDANRGRYTGQNLVTVSPVPVPAAGLLLITGLFGMGALTRRRRKA